MAAELVSPLEVILDSIKLHAIEVDELLVSIVIEIYDLQAFDVVLYIHVFYYFIFIVADGY